MIQIENKMTITTTVNCPKPNSNINTGTTDDSGALAKMLTHMPKILLAVLLVPIMKRSAMPPVIAKNIPMAKAWNVCQAAE